ncbi:hypothetical protein I7Z51_002561 [Vibrio parahaemolyticus]|uniref:hypothetical protein n=2 Tax=Vibrio TaxID=662 RepID=UPI00215D4671|nr:hypothetical protein [Vibrio parahaemolyticus]EGQ7973636.1 hypothetical protein [Vibrio parahaemolyticus]MCR9811908.1 hypothetical protein [Vibrio parahaemolyticus]
MKTILKLRYKDLIDAFEKEKTLSSHERYMTTELPDPKQHGWKGMEEVIKVARTIPVKPEPYNWMSGIVSGFIFALLLLLIQDKQLLSPLVDLIHSKHDELKIMPGVSSWFTPYITDFGAFYLIGLTISALYMILIKGLKDIYLWLILTPFPAAFIAIGLMSVSVSFEPLNLILLTCISQLCANYLHINWAVYDTYHLVNFTVAFLLMLPLGLFHAKAIQGQNVDYKQQVERQYDANTFMLALTNEFLSWNKKTFTANQMFKSACEAEEMLAKILNKLMKDQHVEKLGQLYKDERPREFWLLSYELLQSLDKATAIISKHIESIRHFHLLVKGQDTDFEYIDSKFTKLFHKALEPQIGTLTQLVEQGLAHKEFSAELEHANRVNEMNCSGPEFLQKVSKLSKDVLLLNEEILVLDRAEHGREIRILTGLSQSLAEEMRNSYNVVNSQIEWVRSLK